MNFISYSILFVKYNYNNRFNILLPSEKYCIIKYVLLNIENHKISLRGINILCKVDGNDIFFYMYYNSIPIYFRLSYLKKKTSEFSEKI